jgi:hypothetical protein
MAQTSQLALFAEPLLSGLGQQRRIRRGSRDDLREQSQRSAASPQIRLSFERIVEVLARDRTLVALGRHFVGRRLVQP